MRPERARAAVDERDVVDAEAVFERREAVELLEHGIRTEPGLDADDEPQSVLAVGEVGDIRDAADLLRVDAVLDLLDHAFRADQVGQLGDDESGLASRDRLDGDLGAGLERAAAGRVGIADAGEPDDRAAGRQVGPRNELHQVVERGIRVLEQVARGTDDLDEVVRRHVRGHADGDAARAVDEQVRECRRKNLGLRELVVVVGNEVDDVLVEPVGHREGRAIQPHLGVAGGGGAVVE